MVKLNCYILLNDHFIVWKKLSSYCKFIKSFAWKPIRNLTHATCYFVWSCVIFVNDAAGTAERSGKNKTINLMAHHHQCTIVENAYTAQLNGRWSICYGNELKRRKMIESMRYDMLSSLMVQMMSWLKKLVSLIVANGGLFTLIKSVLLLLLMFIAIKQLATHGTHINGMSNVCTVYFTDFPNHTCVCVSGYVFYQIKYRSFNFQFSIFNYSLHKPWKLFSCCIFVSIYSHLLVVSIWKLVIIVFDLRAFYLFTHFVSDWLL